MARKKYKTNRQLLENIVGDVANLTDKVKHIDDRVDGVHTRTDSLHERFDDLRDHITDQFTNHLDTHDKLNRRLLKGGLALIGLIVIGVGFNNLPAIIKLGTLIWRWI